MIEDLRYNLYYCDERKNHHCLVVVALSCLRHNIREVAVSSRLLPAGNYGGVCRLTGRTGLLDTVQYCIIESSAFFPGTAKIKPATSKERG